MCQANINGNAGWCWPEYLLQGQHMNIDIPDEGEVHQVAMPGNWTNNQQGETQGATPIKCVHCHHLGFNLTLLHMPRPQPRA